MNGRHDSKQVETDDGWSVALQLLQADLSRQGSAAKTRDAYGGDLQQFAAWAFAHQLAPVQVTPRVLRRYMAGLSQAGAAPATGARKLAALRALFASQREHGYMAENPAELVSAPQGSRAAATGAQAARGLEAARRHPRRRAARRYATARCSS